MTDQSLGWPAPAKLNLFLHITGRRADGYHTLQSAFALLDWGDELDFFPRADGRIEGGVGGSAVAPAADLSLRAARLLRERLGRPALGVRIAVRKCIAIGGGLGGGSSNAATTLLALNHLWRGGLSLDALAELGQTLGADVPVFVHGRSAWAEGIGEQLTPLALPAARYCLLHPGVSVPTAELFAAEDLTRDSPPITIDQLSRGECGNAFEPLVARRYPPVAAALGWLRSRYGDGRLSGTGACVFAAVGEHEPAPAAPHSRWRCWMARSAALSAAHRRLAHERWAGRSTSSPPAGWRGGVANAHSGCQSE